MAQFQAGAAPIFLVSLKAGGVGLNLTAADTVIHLDPWWNPAVEQQASARAHRIGQTRPVTVYRLVAAGSIEERLLALQARKAALADAVLGAPQPSGASLDPAGDRHPDSNADDRPHPHSHHRTDHRTDHPQDNRPAISAELAPFALDDLQNLLAPLSGD